MRQIVANVDAWVSKTQCTRCQLQSLLGHLLYIHKCVKPARYFVNRMLELLRQNYDQDHIALTHQFKQDLRWFKSFLKAYNGVSIYDKPPVNHTIELDGMGDGKTLSTTCQYQEVFKIWTIVHLEMVNIILALRVFRPMWSGRRVIVRCDNDAVVQVLSHGRARDPFHAACARNVCYILADIDASFVHVMGKNN